MQDEQGLGAAGADRVDDAEWLFCRVLPGRTPPHCQESGSRLEVLAQAFSQRAVAEGVYRGQYRLSMDRAHLCGGGPKFTQQGGPDLSPLVIGVVRFQARELRAITGVRDVEPEPVWDDPELPDNPAHATVCVHFRPEASKNANRSIFDNVRTNWHRSSTMIPPAGQSCLRPHLPHKVPLSFLSNFYVIPKLEAVGHFSAKLEINGVFKAASI